MTEALSPTRAGSSLLSRTAAWLATIVGVLAIGFTAWLTFGLEPSWRARDEMPQTPEQAFNWGTLGLEVMPLKLALVLADPDIGGKYLVPDRASGDSVDWVSDYGFIANPDATGRRGCADDGRSVLPIGFSLARRLPGNGAAVPVPFVGLACSACHSAQLISVDGDRTPVLLGVGSPHLDVIGWGEAVKNIARDPTLNANKILDAYANQCPRTEDDPPKWIEAFLIDQWLSGFRSQLGLFEKRYDLAASPHDLRNPDAIPTGPGRTRPFRSIVRAALEFPGENNKAYSKIPSTLLQDPSLRPRSHFDGSIGDPVTRSLIAAFASDSTIAALGQAEVAENVRLAADYTLALDQGAGVPSLADAFPSLPSPAPDAVSRGRAVYAQECRDCHGGRSGGGRWEASTAPEFGAIAPIEEIGTDDKRLTFRYAEMLPLGIWTRFPLPPGERDAQRTRLNEAIVTARADGDGAVAGFWSDRLQMFERDRRRYPTGHALAFSGDTLTVNYGYLNGPIPAIWTRAPYLHNGSVPTLSQLLNLEARPGRFCRGRNRIDPEKLGIVAPPPSADGTCPAEYPFLFDTAADGNANTGHAFPAWAFDDDLSDEERGRLEDLMAYLRAL